MNSFDCELCGGKECYKQGESFICQSCGNRQFQTKSRTILGLSQNQTDEIVGLSRNSKMEAIKALKDYSGLGLKESKDYIELLMSDGFDVSKANENFSKMPSLPAAQKSGCSTLAMFIAAVIALAIISALSLTAAAEENTCAPGSHRWEIDRGAESVFCLVCNKQYDCEAEGHTWHISDFTTCFACGADEAWDCDIHDHAWNDFFECLVCDAYVVVFLWGDVNGDGVVNMLDVLEVMRYVLGLPSVFDVDPVAFSAADLNGNGIIDMSVVLIVMQIALGVI
jgi:hypothetical protein